ncbi:MAG: ATP-dependent sacrificial sulfur transferase LarE [bacterium]|nr:ATP-dependent sacrificial sulfur transferase LarE [bacterium]
MDPRYQEIETKLLKLKNSIKNMGKLVVAYSGGVDSTFLVKVAKDVLNDNLIAVTAKSMTYPLREFKEARKVAKLLGVRHIAIETDELNLPEFVNNTIERCYYCKKELFTKLKEISTREKILWVADGTNFDDINDFRPGLRVLKELKIMSPLKEAGLTKAEIRMLSKEMNLPTWAKPSFACLASRFPYGEKITRENLQIVASAEDYLIGLGIKQIRVRHHCNLARIEVGSPGDIILFAKSQFREQVIKKLKSLGYTYVTLDLEGYRTGSMNEAL